MQFCFGSSYDGSVVIEAKNLDHAIRIFKVSELFPEKYVDQKFIKSSDYDSDLRRSIYKYKGDPLICEEVLNVDEITLEEIDYYLQSRLDRKDYLELIPTLIWLKKFKIEENELEEEFCKMIASTLKMDYNKSNKDKIQKAISWWKLKNKWKRALTKEESTAFRMITNKLRKER